MSTQKRLRIGIMGVTGRMGKKLQELVVNDPAYRENYQMIFACSGPNDPRFKRLASSKPDVVIDFSAPASTLKMAKICNENKIPLLVCTTGFDPAQLSAISKSMGRVPWAFVPNTSLGVYVFKNVVEVAAKQLGADYQAEIIETHHIHKKDAPSGTAKLLAQAIIDAGGGHKQVPIHSIRGGTEVGEHSVVFLGSDEKIELIHRAQDRSLFAHGALRLARLLQTRKAKKSNEPYTAAELYS